MHQIQETANFFINTHAQRELNLHISIFRFGLIYKILYDLIIVHKGHDKKRQKDNE